MRASIVRHAGWVLVSVGSWACSNSEPAPALKPGHEVGVPDPSSAPVAQPKPPSKPSPLADKQFGKVVLEEIGVPSAPSKLQVRWKLPAGTEVNDEAPFRIRWKSSEALENAPDDVAAKGHGHQLGFQIAVHPAKGVQVARLLGEVELVVCDAESHSVCLPIKREMDLTFVVGGGAAPTPVTLTLPAVKG